MKALRLEGLEHLTLAEIDPPLITPGQLLIRTGAATICTSDLHDLHHNPFDIVLPVVLGHEGSGTVVEVGADVQGFAVGDRVAAHPVHPCLACDTCRSGLGHVCPNMSHFGLNMQGTFAEYFVVRADRARPLPDHVSFEAAALTEPVCVCLEAVHQSEITTGQHLLIIGDGPFGVIMARLAATITPNVVIAGHHSTRLAFAHPLPTVDARQAADPRQAILDANGGDRYDAVILAVGSKSALAMALDLLKPKGRLVIFAPMPGETPVDLFKVLLNELEIVGSVNDQERMDEAIEALADPRFHFDDLITQRFELDDFQHAFAAAESDRANAMKIAFTF